MNFQILFLTLLLAFTIGCSTKPMRARTDPFFDDEMLESPSRISDPYLIIKMKNNEIFEDEGIIISEGIENINDFVLYDSFNCLDREIFIIGYYPSKEYQEKYECSCVFPETKKTKVQDKLKILQEPIEITITGDDECPIKSEGWDCLGVWCAPIHKTGARKIRSYVHKGLSKYKVNFPDPGIYMIKTSWSSKDNRGIPNSFYGTVTKYIIINVKPKLFPIKIDSKEKIKIDYIVTK